jgi:hypothetical protein
MPHEILGSTMATKGTDGTKTNLAPFCAFCGLTMNARLTLRGAYKRTERIRIYPEPSLRLLAAIPPVPASFASTSPASPDWCGESS